MRTLTAGAALIAALLLPMAASANDDADEPAEETIEADARLMLVLDASGSMEQPTEDGTPRIEAARSALAEVVRTLPDEAHVGMRVYGARLDSDSSADHCQDTDLVVPVGPLDRDELNTQIGAYEPRGNTPTGPALRAAADDFEEGQRKVIVLLSDGESTCDPDPCDVAEQLDEDEGITVHAVGLGVNDEARAELECITDASGGTYYDVDNPELLTSSLRAISVRALRDLTLRGEAIRGGASSTDATVIEPGRYTDAVQGGDTSRFYAIDRPENGGVGVTVTGHPERPTDRFATERISVDLMTPDGTGCASGNDSLGGRVSNRTLSTHAFFTPAIDQDVDPACEAAERLVVEVKNSGDEEQYPVELTAWTFPEVSDPQELPPMVEDEEYDAAVVPAQASGEVENITGGSTLSDAPIVEDGSYRDTIQPGEQLVYRVRADWGQTPRFTATLGADNRAASILGNGWVNIQATWASPARHLFDARSGTDSDATGSTNYHGDRPASVTAAAPQIRYLNRGSDVDSIASAFLPGYYYFLIEAAPRDGAEGMAIPFQLNVEVDGEVSGEPDFVGEIAGPEDELAEAAEDAVSEDGFPWLAVTLVTLGALLLIGAAVIITIVMVGRRRRT